MNAHTSSSSLKASQVRKRWMEITKKQSSTKPATASALLSMLVLRQVQRSHRKRAPFAPVLDTYTFLPAPQSSPVLPYEEEESHPAVPCNTPAGSPSQSPPALLNDTTTTSRGDKESSAEIETPVLAGNNNTARVQLEYRLSEGRTGLGLVGLGIEGIMKGNGKRFDGLGRLSDGFKTPLGDDTTYERTATHEVGEEERKIITGTRRSRARTVVQPRKRHDVFFPSASYNCFPSTSNSSRAQTGMKPFPVSTERTGHMYIRSRTRYRPNKPDSPTKAIAARVRHSREPSKVNGSEGKQDVSRATISTELKRTASLARRAKLGLGAEPTWRV